MCVSNSSDPDLGGTTLVPVGQESTAGNGGHVRKTRERNNGVLRIKRQRRDNRRSDNSRGGGRRWRADRGSLRDAACGAGDRRVARDCWPVGKKAVIKLFGLCGGSVDSARLLDRSVDGKKVARERDVERGRHCARLDMCVVW